MTIGLINSCYLDFLRSRLGPAAVEHFLAEVGLPPNASFISSCPYADSMLERCVLIAEVVNCGRENDCDFCLRCSIMSVAALSQEDAYELNYAFGKFFVGWAKQGTYGKVSQLAAIQNLATCMDAHHGKLKMKSSIILMQLLHCLGGTFVDFMRSLNNLHLHLSLGMPGLISPEFLIEDVSNGLLVFPHFAPLPILHHSMATGDSNIHEAPLLQSEAGVGPVGGRHCG